MTEPVQLALIASIPPTLVALAGLLVSIGNRWRTNETKALVVETKAAQVETQALVVETKAAQVETLTKVDAVDAKAVDIKTIANGANTELKTELKVATERIAGLEKLFAQMMENKKETAVAQAALLTAAIAAPAPEVTAAILENTKQQAAINETLEHDRRNRKTAALALAAALAEQTFAITEANLTAAAADRAKDHTP